MAATISKQNKIVVKIGSSFQRIVTLQGKSLVGATIKSEIKEKKLGEVIGEWTIDIIDDDKFSMTIHPDITEQLVTQGDYYSDVKVTFAGGFVRYYLMTQIVAEEIVTA